MKRLFQFVLLLSCALPCLAQGNPQPYLVFTLVGGVLTSFPASTTLVPGGNPPPVLCETLNNSGQLAYCSTGAGTGTVTQVSGTANQIDVATGTTTPVLSLDPAIIFPGTLVGVGATGGAPIAGGINATQYLLNGASILPIASPQYQLPFYSAVGTSNALTGSNITTDSTLNDLNVPGVVTVTSSTSAATSIQMAPNANAPATVSGYALIGPAPTITTPSFMELLGAPCSGAFTLTNASGVMSSGCTPFLGTGANLPTASTLAGTLAPVCYSSTGLTTSGCSTSSFTGGTVSGATVFSAAGAASTPGLQVSGAPFTGGSTSTTWPQLYIYSTGTQPTFSASGTMLGINSPSGFAGPEFVIWANGSASVFSVSTAGVTNQSGSSTIASASQYGWASSTSVKSPSNGILQIQNNAGTGFTRLVMGGGTTSSYAAFCTSGVAISVCDGSGGTAATLASPVFNPTAVQTTVGCSVLGTAIFSQPFQGASDKKVVIHLSTCTGTASYTYPVAFTNAPSIFASNNVAASIATSVSTTAVTVTGSASTGSLILEDY